MIHLDLTPEELSVIQKSINNCLETCQQGGAEKGCDDCRLLEKILGKLEQH
ncbi:MAG: hypothetical protein M1379_13605 [Firmicutes bacterium]|nr:hypothetical protein [Bacillota bacterium]